MGVATRVGTIIIREGLQTQAVQSQSRERTIRYYSQRNVLILVPRHSARVNIRRCAHTSSPELGKCREVVAHHVNRRVPFHAWARHRKDLRIPHESDLLEESLDRRIRNAAKKRAQWYRDESESERDAPLTSANVGNLESGTADENNQDLHTDFCNTICQPRLRVGRQVTWDEPINVMAMK